LADSAMCPADDKPAKVPSQWPRSMRESVAVLRLDHVRCRIPQSLEWCSRHSKLHEGQTKGQMAKTTGYCNAVSPTERAET
jgi:hypothetical protein